MLYIVSAPIGNPDDITLRALRILREANAVICEERRAGARLLNNYQLQKELIELNEHTERERIPELIARLKRGETLALISDHGTPLLADPGARLTERANALSFILLRTDFASRVASLSGRTSAQAVVKPASSSHAKRTLASSVSRGTPV